MRNKKRRCLLLRPQQLAAEKQAESRKKESYGKS
jgi:hypothetical protein